MFSAFNPAHRCHQQGTQAYSEPCQTSKMERFAEIVNGCSILDVWQGSEYAYWILWNAIPEWNLNWQMTILTPNSFKKVSLFSSLRLILPGMTQFLFFPQSIWFPSKKNITSKSMLTDFNHQALKTMFVVAEYSLYH